MLFTLVNGQVMKTANAPDNLIPGAKPMPTELAKRLMPDEGGDVKLSKKQKKAMLGDLREVNKLLRKIREKKGKVNFRLIGRREDLCVVGVCDASYHIDHNSLGGEVIMVEKKKTKDVSPIYWKSGVIRKVCM